MGRLEDIDDFTKEIFGLEYSVHFILVEVKGSTLHGIFIEQLSQFIQEVALSFKPGEIKILTPPGFGLRESYIIGSYDIMDRFLEVLKSKDLSRDFKYRDLHRIEVQRWTQNKNESLDGWTSHNNWFLEKRVGEAEPGLFLFWDSMSGEFGTISEFKSKK